MRGLSSSSLAPPPLACLVGAPPAGSKGAAARLMQGDASNQHSTKAAPLPLLQTLPQPKRTCCWPSCTMCLTSTWHMGQRGCRRVRHHWRKHSKLQPKRSGGRAGRQVAAQRWATAAGGGAHHEVSLRAARALRVSNTGPCISLPVLLPTEAVGDGGRLFRWVEAYGAPLWLFFFRAVRHAARAGGKDRQGAPKKTE